MRKLSQESCEACRADAPQVSDEELKELIGKIPDWNIEVRNGVMQLEKTFTFDNFVSALAFTNKVGEAAEAEGHHPALLTEWGRVTVRYRPPAFMQNSNRTPPMSPAWLPARSHRARCWHRNRRFQSICATT